MSDLILSRVSDTHGPVNLGAGDQVNNLLYLTDSKGRDPRRQAADELQWLTQRFIHPTGFRTALETLRAHRTVFLDAHPGSGRTATAKILLRELSPDSELTHQLLLREKESASPLDLSHIGDGDLVWLDLSGDTIGWSWDEIHDELSDLRNTVREHAAYLVVVLPHHAVLQAELAQYRVKIEPPPLQEVLHRYLRTDSIVPPIPLPPLKFLTENRPLREIPRFVQLIKEAKEKAPGEENFATWCVTAYRALSGREREVADLVARLSQGPQRALLLATAMLYGAHADSIHRASRSLLATAEHPSDDGSILEHAALDQRLKEIEAELDASGHVRFTELDTDSAVRTYFWTHMPELRDRICSWVGSTVDSTDLTGADRENLIARFTEQCLSDRYKWAWVSLVQRCTEQPTNDRRMTAAAQVLQHGLQDEENSRTFRRQLYDWSCSPLSERLADVIIVACRDEMMISHPDEALVRLHHVARREHRTRARDELITLIGGDRRFLRQMLNRLTDRNPEARKWPADTGIFLEIADPAAITNPGPRGRPLLDESTVRHQLAEGWRLVFANLPDETWGSRAQDWLYLAAEDGRCRDELLDVLIAAGGQRIDVLARLYVMTRREAVCAVICDNLLQKINAAQGIQFT